MQRIVGFVMIILGCSGMGVWYTRQFGQRLERIQQMIWILESLSAEIRYMRASLPECCRKLSKEAPEPYAQAFGKCLADFQKNTGRQICEICAEALSDCMDGLPVHRQERELFLGAFAVEKASDEESRCRSIEGAVEALKRIAVRLEQEKPEKSKMAVGLGVMSGMLLVILLL